MCTLIISNNAIKHNIEKLKIETELSTTRKAKAVLIHSDDFRCHYEQRLLNVLKKFIFNQIKPPEIYMAV